MILAAPVFLQFAGGLALGVSLLPGETVAPDFQFELFAERVDATYSYAVQSAGNFVGVAVELAASVQRSHHYLRGGNLFAVDIHVIDWNAASVIDHSDGVIEMDCNFDLIGVTGERLVHRVIHDFVDEVMQAEFAGRADIHGGALAYGFHAAKDFDGVGGVISVAFAVLVFRVVSRVEKFGLQFFGGHSAPWRKPGPTTAGQIRAVVGTGSDA